MAEKIPLPDLPDDMLGRHFSNAVLTWKISNFTLALCPTSIVITGPEFTLSGPVPTSWRMLLEISSEHERILLHLEMLPHEIQNLRATVSFRANVMDPQSSGVALFVERNFTFLPNGRFTVEMVHLMNIVKRLTQASPDVLRMKCNMLVTFGYTPQFPKPSCRGVVSLAHDLAQLPRDSLFSDVKIKVHGCELKVHRGMLCHRSAELNALLQTEAENTIGLYLTDSKAVDAIFAYLYSGDLFWVLSEPSIMIYQYIERFGIPELKEAYPVEKQKMESKIVASEYVFRWTICDFKNVTEVLDSPVFEERGMDARWQLHLHPNGPRNANELQEKFVHIEAELLESAKPELHVCLEFVSVNKDGEPLHTRRIHERMNVGDKLGLDFFQGEKGNIERCLVEGALFLRFKLRIAAGQITSRMTETRLPDPVTVNNERTYMILSQMMGLLLASHSYTDVNIHVDDECFRAHRFVLASRSIAFKRLLQDSSKQSSVVTVTIPNVKKHIFRVFLEFLYTGILIDSDLPVVTGVYDLAVGFLVPTLKDICVDTLVRLVRGDVDSAITYLLWADDRKETTVKNCVLNIIDVMRNDMVNHRHWSYLQHEKPSLFQDVLLHLNRDSREADANANVTEGS